MSASSTRRGRDAKLTFSIEYPRLLILEADELLCSPDALTDQPLLFGEQPELLLSIIDTQWDRWLGRPRHFWVL